MLSVLALVLSGITSYGQNLNAEVPGDNFSLEGALELFKKSESPEHFERLLNSPDSKVNNLDLNGDGYIDYIRVFDRYEGNVHAFILQAVISERESQDIAVIELEKLANGKAVLQIIGDADIYGVETIIEPTSEVRTYAGAMRSTTVVNVWSWPSVQFIYGPYYSGWYSPWYWHFYPVWWRTWVPVAYVHYHPIYVTYSPYYSYCHTRRIVYAQHIYRPYRTTSIIVYNRHRDRITHFRSAYPDGYRNSYVRNNPQREFESGRSRERIVEQSYGSNQNSGRNSRQREFASQRNDYNNRETTSESRNPSGVKREAFKRQKATTNSDGTYNRTRSYNEGNSTEGQPTRERNVQTGRNSSEVREKNVQDRSFSRTRESQSNGNNSVQTQRRTSERSTSQNSSHVQTHRQTSGGSHGNVERRQSGSSPSFERKSSGGNSNAGQPANKQNHGSRSGRGR
jgi:hypothetical protein